MGDETDLILHALIIDLIPPQAHLSFFFFLTHNPVITTAQLTVFWQAHWVYNLSQVKRETLYKKHFKQQRATLPNFSF